MKPKMNTEERRSCMWSFSMSKFFLFDQSDHLSRLDTGHSALHPAPPPLASPPITAGGTRREAESDRKLPLPQQVTGVKTIDIINRQLI